MAPVIEEFPDLGIRRVSRWCFNTYILDGDDGQLVIVDPGIPHIARDVDNLLADTGRPVACVTATHGHPDHVAGAPFLAQRHNAPIHLPATTMTYLDGIKPRTPSVAKLIRTWRLLFGQPFDGRASRGSYKLRQQSVSEPPAECSGPALAPLGQPLPMETHYPEHRNGL
ncbi:UNVERIFIED_CONTAM: metallo-beta-lactamase superfamily protein [Williamsia faeni]